MPPSRVAFQDAPTPLGSPSPDERLLDDDTVQYATYPEADPVKMGPNLGVGRNVVWERPWVPLPLRVWFWVPFVVLLVIIAIGLEVALHFSRTKNGWPSSSNFGNKANFLHYVYTLPPVAIVAVFAAMWAWTDLEIKKMQPYVDLVHGNSLPRRSLLLDYTRSNNFIVWTQATSNRHYLVALASLMVILTLAFQPLAAALLVVNNVWWHVPDQTMTNLQKIGLNQNQQFDDLSSFLTATGYASSTVLYNLPNPPFVFDGYTVAQFSLPTDVIANGTTVTVNTTAILSEPGCQAVDVNMQVNGTGWTNSINSSSCSISFDVDRSADVLFGTSAVTCTDNPQPAQFQPVLFWFFTYEPTPMSSATLCFPNITLWDVTAKLDLASGLVTGVTQLQPLSSSSNFSSASGNVTGAPLNGRAYNGIEFDLDDPDVYVVARRNATQLQMPAAIYQTALLSKAGLDGSFEANTFANMSQNVYRTYLSLIAKTVYFLSDNEPINVGIMTIQPRVFFSDVAVHLLAVAMIILAIFATIVQLFHRYDRKYLRLQHEPGTIASAVSIGGQTGIGELLSGRQREEDMDEVLRNHRFRIDRTTMKIIMEGEEGYETAKTPTARDRQDRRRSIFAAVQLNESSTFKRQFSWRSPKAPESLN